MSEENWAMEWQVRALIKDDRTGDHDERRGGCTTQHKDLIEKYDEKVQENTHPTILSSYNELVFRCQEVFFMK